MFCLGCINTNAKYEAYEQLTFIDDQFELSIVNGKVDSICRSNGNNFYNIYFEESRGGSSYLFGVFKINEHDGHDYKRLVILDKNSKVITSLSINDLRKSKMDTVNLNAFLVE